MLTILMGRAKTGKSDTVLRRIADLGDMHGVVLPFQHFPQDSTDVWKRQWGG